MLDALTALFQGITPTVLFAFLLGHLMLVEEFARLRATRRGRLYLGLVFGLMSVVGAFFGPRAHGLYVDTALFVVVAGGWEGGLTCGAVAGLIGGLVRALDPVAMRPFAAITLLGGLAGGALHALAGGRPLSLGKGFALGAAVGAAQGLVTAFLLGPRPPRLHVAQAVLPLAALTGLGLTAFLLILRSLEARAAHARLRAELAETRMRFLQAQIRPHFLFNALTTIASLVRSDPARARAVVQELAEFLRATFRPHAETVPLEEELAIVRAYLEVERARFGDRLRYAEVVEPECRSQPVPPFLLQPLVENSVRHAFREDGRPLELGLTARRDGARLVIAVQDDGIGISPERLAALSGTAAPATAPPEPEPESGSGIGLANCRERVSRFAAAATGREAGTPGVTLTSTPGVGTRIEVRLPWRA